MVWYHKNINPIEKQEYIPLATNAVCMDTLVARNLIKPTTKYMK